MKGEVRANGRLVKQVKNCEETAKRKSESVFST